MTIFRFPTRFHVVSNRIPQPGDFIVASFEYGDELLLVLNVKKIEKSEMVTGNFLNDRGILKHTWFGSYTLFLGSEDRT